MAFFSENMKYIEFSKNNPRCIHCFINDRAYASIITEVLTNGQNETGGVLLGYIVNRAWYIVESIDPGLDTVNQIAFFQWDTEYVNHQAERLSKIYNKPLTVLGFWHRHPGSMDYFSLQDETTIRKNLRELRAGLLSMLVNIDPKLRMTFYYCYDNDIMPIRYDVGNKYFPVELMKYADSTELTRRAAAANRFTDIHYKQVIDLDAVAKRKKYKTESEGVPSIINKDETELRDLSSVSTVTNQHSNMYSDNLTDTTIKRIAEIVLGIEGDTKVQIESLSDKMAYLEKTVEVLVGKTEEILIKINSAEKSEMNESDSTVLIKSAQNNSENVVENITENNRSFNDDDEIAFVETEYNELKTDSDTEELVLLDSDNIGTLDNDTQ